QAALDAPPGRSPGAPAGRVPAPRRVETRGREFRAGSEPRNIELLDQAGFALDLGFLEVAQLLRPGGEATEVALVEISLALRIRVDVEQRRFELAHDVGRGVLRREHAPPRYLEEIAITELLQRRNLRQRGHALLGGHRK